MCTSTAQVTCDDGHFQCLSDGECIPDVWLCDDEEDCEDGSDERQHCRKCIFTLKANKLYFKIWTHGKENFLLSQNDFAMCPQLEGRAPVISSAVAMEPASQENTSVTTWKTAWMGLTRDPAVSRLPGGSLFRVLDRSLLWHFNQFVEIKRLVD